ncbi:MAG: restriction endonuclease, partial [Nitrospirae bacterium]|nr:restriction endonuclease [Nitrospirota bacterium]
EQLPAIRGWKPIAEPMNLNELGQWRLDAIEIGEISATVAADEAASQPGKELSKYRFLMNKERKALISKILNNLVNSIDTKIHSWNLPSEPPIKEEVELLQDVASQIETLLGSSIKHPNRWSDFLRHLHFAGLNDFNDILNFDWPTIKEELQTIVYETNDPIPVGFDDLSILTEKKLEGTVSGRLKWNRLKAENFERLMFKLISSVKGYENPQWLTLTNAPDKGRDLSIERVVLDELAGTIRSRVIIQCKHWLDKSVSISEIGKLKEQMKLWEPPKVNVVVIATSGRFTTDTVKSIELHNQSASGLIIEMWPESHLESLLAKNPAIIAEFNLR